MALKAFIKTNVKLQIVKLCWFIKRENFTQTSEHDSVNKSQRQVEHAIHALFSDVCYTLEFPKVLVRHKSIDSTLKTDQPGNLVISYRT